MHRPPTRDLRAIRRDGPVDDAVLVEAPLTIRVAVGLADPEPVFTTLRTPGHDLDLALGWARSEGLVRTLDDVLDVHRCTDPHGRADPDGVTVRLRPAAAPDVAALRRRGTATAACGLCGRDDVDAVVHRCPPPPRDDVRTDLDVLAEVADEVRRRQALFALTGGCHAAATATADGHVVHVREDVGRHNAVDAVLGTSLRHDDAPVDVLLLSGRAGAELLAKAVASRVAVVASVGAATQLAVEVAAAAGTTLVAFVGRDHGGTVLTRPDRLGLASPRTDEVPA